MALCSKCSAQLVEGWRFCSACGQPVGTAAPAARSTEPEQAKTNMTAMDLVSAFDNISRSVGINVSYGEKMDTELKQRRESTQVIASPPCEKCGIDKDAIIKKQQEQQKSVEEARAKGVGMMMMGMTPSRDFYKCPECGKIACSVCASGNCPFCSHQFTEQAIFIKSKHPLRQE